MKRIFRGGEWVAPFAFLFILPITHTTPLRVLLLVVSLVWAIATFKRRRPIVLPANYLICALIYWVAVCVVLSIHSVDPSYSWGEFRNEVFSTVCAFGIFFVVTDSDRIRRIWKIALLASFGTICALALFSYVRTDDWLRSSLVGDRNAYSTYVVLIFPFLVFLWTRTAAADRARRLAVGGAMLLGLISAAFTQNRNLWFAIGCELLVWSLLVYFRLVPEVRRRLRPHFLAVGFVCAIGFAGAFAYVIYSKALVSNMTPESQARFDQDPRFEIWAYAVDRIAERPWLGHGYGRGILRSDFRTHFNNPLKWHGHNIVINYFIEGGLLGGTAILALFAALFAQSWALYRKPEVDTWQHGAWALVMLVGISLKIMTDDILVRDNALLFWSTLGIIFGSCVRKGRVDPVAAGRRA